MALKQKLIPLHAKQEWEAALADIFDHAYTHTHWYNQAMHSASGRDIFLYVAQNENFNIVCPISPRHKSLQDLPDITTPYGFSGFAYHGDCHDFTENWYTFMRQQGYICGHIALHPFVKAEFTYKSQDLFAGKTTYLLDLTLDLEFIRQNFSTDHRHRLRQWQKAGHVVCRDKKENIIAAFVKHYSNALQARSAAAVYDFGEIAWRQIIASPHSYLFSVAVDNNIQAVAIFIHYNHIVDYYMIASDDEGRAHARGILFDAMSYFHEQGAKWLHLGCGVREGDALQQFKARFGGKAVTTYALKQIYDPSAYAQSCARYDVDPQNIAGYFPAYWAEREKEEKI